MDGTVEELSTLFSSYCCLKSLTLQNIVFAQGHEVLIAILRGLPSLETLELVQNRWYRSPRTEGLSDSIIYALCGNSQLNAQTYTFRNCPILPSLRHLTLEACRSRISDKALVELVTSRWRPGRPSTSGEANGNELASLRSVSFTVENGTINIAILQPLAHMAAAGLSVKVVDSTGWRGFDRPSTTTHRMKV
jgi:hypothetical protein